MTHDWQWSLPWRHIFREGDYLSKFVFSYFFYFVERSKHGCPNQYQYHIWGVSTQIGYHDTTLMNMWPNGFHRLLCHIERILSWKWNEYTERLNNFNLTDIPFLHFSEIERYWKRMNVLYNDILTLLNLNGNLLGYVQLRSRHAPFMWIATIS